MFVFKQAVVSIYYKIP